LPVGRREVQLGAVHLLVEVHGVDKKGQGGEAKDPGKNDRGISSTSARLNLVGGLDKLRKNVVDVVTGTGVGVTGILEVGLALADFLAVHFFAELDDLVFVLLVVLVLIVGVLGFLARDAVVLDERFGGARVGKGASVVVQGLVGSRFGEVGAAGIDEGSEVDLASVGRAVGSDVVDLPVTVSVVVVVLVLDLFALEVTLDLELFLLRASVVVLDTVFTTILSVALVLADFVVVGVVAVAVLANLLALELGGFQLGLGVGVDEVTHVDDVLASTRAAVGAASARARGTKAEGNEVLGVGEGAIFGIATAFLSVGLDQGVALVELDVVAREPVVRVVLVQGTSLAHELASDPGIGPDGGISTDGVDGHGRSGEGSSNEGAEQHREGFLQYGQQQQAQRQKV
jgi:hypothetical protein